MTALEQHYVVVLEKVLDSDFIPHLPPLLNNTKSPDDQLKKNRSRAFSAFALHNTCGISQQNAAQSVVDDFDDYGIDAIYYHATSDTLYLVQSKLKASEQFSQDEALAFCQGIRKLIQLDLSGFNANVQKRKTEIEDAIENCAHIKLVVAHIGSGISKHAKDAIEELVTDEDHGESRLDPEVVDYDSKAIIHDLQAAKAFERVDTDLLVQKYRMIGEPRPTYFGVIGLDVLVKLHDKHGKALYERNIRTFLGHKTEVNTAIRNTLETSPQDFFYLNNGVTAIADTIEPRGPSGASRKLKVRGLSVINGAQTIASSAKFVSDTGGDVSNAKVLLTIIKASADGFGKLITQARNHQNPVMFWNFAALDDEQERLRRDLAYLGIHYAYKGEATDAHESAATIRIDEAAQALVLFENDPRYVVRLKTEPGSLLNTTSSQYKAIFSPFLTAFRLANAVRFRRYVLSRVVTESLQSSGLQRLAYKHGNHAIAWVLAKRISSAVNSAALIDATKLAAVLGAPFDQLRETYWNKTHDLTRTGLKGPLALFRSQQDTVPLLQAVCIEYYRLSADPVVAHKMQQHKPGQQYPEDLFAYLVSKAPQIGNLV